MIGENVEIDLRAGPGLWLVKADPVQIEQVIMNLALNARDAMPDGGTLVIEAAPAEVDEEQSAVQPELRAGRCARLLVSDTGTGMTPEVVAHAFDPFFTTKPGGNGAGLGLATVHGIIGEAGGSVRVYSEPNVGTTVRIHVPLSDRSGTLATVPPAAQPPRGRGQRVLVVEDEDAVRELVVRILERNGYRVLASGRGPAALAQAEHWPCDLLLTDVVMPEMSGREVAERIRRRYPGLAVLYMSGYSNELISSRHLLDGDIDLVQKPFSAAELLTMIDKALVRGCGQGPAAGCPTPGGHP
jgi:two-component system cell cycle sensor histidine kinase/response regulator CckA